MDSWAIDLAREEQVEVYSEVGENSYSYDYDYVEQKSTRDDGYVSLDTCSEVSQEDKIDANEELLKHGNNSEVKRIKKNAKQREREQLKGNLLKELQKKLEQNNMVRAKTGTRRRRLTELQTLVYTGQLVEKIIKEKSVRLKL